MRLVLVTRPHEQGQKLAEELRQNGHDTLLESLLKITPTNRPWPDFAKAQAILVTSANALRFMPKEALPLSIPLLCVGDATANLAKSMGFQEVTSASGTSEDLIRLTITHCKQLKGNVLLIAGLHSGLFLAKALRNADFFVDIWHNYRVNAASSFTPELCQALQTGKIGNVLLFSARSAHTFKRLAVKEGVAELCYNVRALCLSPKVASALNGMQWCEVLVAARPDKAALLDLLDKSTRETS